MIPIPGDFERQYIGYSLKTHCQRQGYWIESRSTSKVKMTRTIEPHHEDTGGDL